MFILTCNTVHTKLHSIHVAKSLKTIKGVSFSCYDTLFVLSFVLTVEFYKYPTWSFKMWHIPGTHNQTDPHAKCGKTNSIDDFFIFV